MAEPERSSLHPLTPTVTLIMVCAIWLVMISFTSLLMTTPGNSAEVNQVKIECFLHRDNPDVHKLCVDHGYDR